MPDLPTVSDVRWGPEGRGRCPDCGRDGQALGRVNLAHPSAARLACIDCHFGPPREFWAGCPACGLWQPEGDRCDGCGADFYPESPPFESGMIPW